MGFGLKPSTTWPRQSLRPSIRPTTRTKRPGRRANQLGLRGRMLARYAREWTLRIEDITAFVREQAVLVRSSEERRDLLVPHAEVYWPASAETAARIGLTPD